MVFCIFQTICGIIWGCGAGAHMPPPFCLGWKKKNHQKYRKNAFSENHPLLHLYAILCIISLPECTSHAQCIHRILQRRSSSSSPFFDTIPVSSSLVRGTPPPPRSYPCDVSTRVCIWYYAVFGHPAPRVYLYILTPYFSRAPNAIRREFRVYIYRDGTVQL